MSESNGPDTFSHPTTNVVHQNCSNRFGHPKSHKPASNWGGWGVRTYATLDPDNSDPPRNPSLHVYSRTLYAVHSLRLDRSHANPHFDGVVTEKPTPTLPALKLRRSAFLGY